MLWGLSSLVFFKKRVQSRDIDVEQFIEQSKAISPRKVRSCLETGNSLVNSVWFLRDFMSMHELSGIFKGKLIPLLSQIMVDQITLTAFPSLFSTKGKCVKTTMLSRM